MDSQILLRLGWGALRYRLWGARAPLNVMVAVTNRCPARCVYCDIPARKQQERTTAELLDLVDLLADRGCARIGFWGGEPLVRQDLPRILARVRRRHLWCSVVTNGWLLPRRAPELRGVDHFLISLDGRPENHYAQRGEGAYAKVLRALRYATDHHLPFWTITVLTQKNLGDIPFVLDLAERYGFRATFQLLHHSTELAGAAGNRLQAGEATRAALRQLKAAKAAGRPVAMSDRVLDYLMKWPDYQKNTLPGVHDGLPCLAGKLYANVDADGRLYPCSLRVGQPGAPLACHPLPMDQLTHPGCEACLATAFTEYNALFGLDTATIAGWVRRLARP